jgi:hypothetical protein
LTRDNDHWQNNKISNGGFMKTEQRRWRKNGSWMPNAPTSLGDSAQVVLAFSSTQILNERGILSAIQKIYPGAHIMGCSTSGEILDTQVSDNTLVTTAIHFEHTKIKTAHINLRDVGGSSFEAGAFLARSLEKNGLVHVLVLSDGLSVNGTELAKGLIKNLPERVCVTGGLAGDSDQFKETLVIGAQAQPQKDIVSVLGLYGDRLKVGWGSVHGWDPFGPERLVTRSKTNILYELDGRSALELYKEYLGEQSKGLPATALLFPLSVRVEQDATPVVRTILAVSEKDQSMTFAGDIPEGSYARFMKANFDRLIDGAVGAAKVSHNALNNKSPDLAILISCVGRKLILRQRTEEEVEGVRDVLGKKSALIGFYSYGELCPSSIDSRCDLHNQTMTITTLLEE